MALRRKKRKKVDIVWFARQLFRDTEGQDFCLEDPPSWRFNQEDERGKPIFRKQFKELESMGVIKVTEGFKFRDGSEIYHLHRASWVFNPKELDTRPSRLDALKYEKAKKKGKHDVNLINDPEAEENIDWEEVVQDTRPEESANKKYEILLNRDVRIPLDSYVRFLTLVRELPQKTEATTAHSVEKGAVAELRFPLWKLEYDPGERLVFVRFLIRLNLIHCSGWVRSKEETSRSKRVPIFTFCNGEYQKLLGTLGALVRSKLATKAERTLANELGIV